MFVEVAKQTFRKVDALPLTIIATRQQGRAYADICNWKFKAFVRSRCHDLRWQGFPYGWRRTLSFCCCGTEWGRVSENCFSLKEIALQRVSMVASSSTRSHKA